jgi:hypothetical protein
MLIKIMEDTDLQIGYTSILTMIAMELVTKWNMTGG